MARKNLAPSQRRVMVIVSGVRRLLFNAFEGGDALIGTTMIDLEERLLVLEMAGMRGGGGAKGSSAAGRPAALMPIEHRPLWHPGAPNAVGYVACWLEIVPAREARYAPVDDSFRALAKAPFEVRLIVYKVEDLEFDGLCDMFVKCRVGGADYQSTDTHLRAEGGDGSFNWRMKYDVELPLLGEGAGQLAIQAR